MTRVVFDTNIIVSILINVNALKELTEALKKHARRIILYGSCSQGTDVRE